MGPKAGLDVGQRRKNLLPVPEFEPRIAQPVAWTPRLLPTCLRGDVTFVVWACCKKVKQSPAVAQRVPGGLGSQIFMTFGA
jgi:hypothetical protein